LWLSKQEEISSVGREHLANYTGREVAARERRSSSRSGMIPASSLFIIDLHGKTGFGKTTREK